MGLFPVLWTKRLERKTKELANLQSITQYILRLPLREQDHFRWAVPQKPGKNALYVRMGKGIDIIGNIVNKGKIEFTVPRKRIGVFPGDEGIVLQPCEGFPFRVPGFSVPAGVFGCVHIRT